MITAGPLSWVRPDSERPMKPPIKSLANLKPAPAATGAYDRPTPKVSRLKKAKVLTDAERAAFLASRPDLARKP